MTMKQPTIDDIYMADAYLATPGVRQGLLERAADGNDDEVVTEDTDDGQVVYYRTPYGEMVPVGRPKQMAPVGPPGTRPGDVLVAEVGSRNLPEQAYSGRYPDTIKPFDPTVRQQLADFLQAGFEKLGMDRFRARKQAQTLIGGESSNLPLALGLADIVPFLGTALQTQEAARMGEQAVQSAQQGNLGTAAIQAGGAALGMIPGAAGTVKAARATGRVLAPKAGEMLGDYMQRSGLQMNLMAYHGSPKKFDKFDPTKIGSGEGAQAYGYGLYFAESRDVADSYRIRLSYDPSQMRVGGKQINDFYRSIEQGAARMPPAKAQAEYEKLDVLERLMMNQMPSELVDHVGSLSPATKAWFEKTIVPSFQTYGNMYTVDIPDALVDKMLDFDAPLSQQSPEIQALAQKYNLSMDDLGGDLLAAAGGKTAKGAQIMREAGIPGVRYLDQGSRGDGNGTRNIVVFPGGEDQIKIIKTEGAK